MKNKFFILQKNSIPGLPKYRNSFSGSVKNQLSEDLFENHPVKNIESRFPAESHPMKSYKIQLPGKNRPTKNIEPRFPYESHPMENKEIQISTGSSPMKKPESLFPLENHPVKNCHGNSVYYEKKPMKILQGSFFLFQHPSINTTLLTEKAESEAITLMKLFTICTLFFYSLFFLMIKIPYLLFFTKLTTGRHQVSIKKPFKYEQRLFQQNNIH